MSLPQKIRECSPTVDILYRHSRSTPRMYTFHPASCIRTRRNNWCSFIISCRYCRGSRESRLSGNGARKSFWVRIYPSVLRQLFHAKFWTHKHRMEEWLNHPTPSLWRPQFAIRWPACEVKFFNQFLHRFDTDKLPISCTYFNMSKTPVLNLTCIHIMLRIQRMHSLSLKLLAKTSAPFIIWFTYPGLCHASPRIMDAELLVTVDFVHFVFGRCTRFIFSSPLHHPPLSIDIVRQSGYKVFFTEIPLVKWIIGFPVVENMGGILVSLPGHSCLKLASVPPNTLLYTKRRSTKMKTFNTPFSQSPPKITMNYFLKLTCRDMVLFERGARRHWTVASDRRHFLPARNPPRRALESSQSLGLGVSRTSLRGDEAF
ncbi:unnamed protein product, partial [Nesidiocoris tenuis]